MLTRLVLLATLAAAPAFAQSALSGDAIRTAIGGNTVQGAMSDGAAYTEFYGADGVIRGAGYVGTWSIEGDAMCFAYDGVEGQTCFGMALNGDQVTWLGDGAVAGTGTIVAGNPNGF